MKIQQNSRQMPKDKEYLSNMNYCDYLYSYLQVISKWDGKSSSMRYIPKKDFSFTKIAEDLGVSRQTISKKFKTLLEGQPDSLALIRKGKKGYYLLPLEKNLAMLVPFGTLQVLTSTVSQHVISIYIYLLNRYIANFQSSFRYTIDELKAVIGISTKTRSNNYIITSILFLLQKLGLIKREKRVIDQQTFSYITWMTNHIQNLPEGLKEQEKQFEEYQRTYEKLVKRCQN